MVHWARYGLVRSRQRLAYGAGIPENLQAHPLTAAQAPALTTALALRAATLRPRWDGLLAHWLLPSGVVAAVVGRGLPRLALAHSGDVWLLERAGPAGTLLVRTLSRAGVTLAAVNPQLARRIEHLRADERAPPVELCPLGPRDHRPASEGARRRIAAAILEDPRPLIAVVARLVPIKGVDLLLDALARPEASGLRVAIAGDGPERSHLEALAEELGVEATFLGEVDPDERSALLERADLLTVPSLTLPGGRSEGTPLAVIEAMAAGLPVVASDVGGMGWALADAGMLVPPGDAEALGRALGKLRDAPSARSELGRRGRQRAREFGWERAAARIEATLGRKLT